MARNVRRAVCETRMRVWAVLSCRRHERRSAEGAPGGHIDRSRCYAYLTDNASSSTPSDCERSGGKWSTGGSNGSWQEEPGMRSTMVAASQDKFVRLRVDMEAEMKSYGLTESKDLKALWKKMDKDGNNEIEISEVLDLTQELVKSGIWPKWMSYPERSAGHLRKFSSFSE
ncbi:unnamed protein product [Prorocentrum cordatum]|uniref:EF-hand domain-containing protein n=1 Tax=Prorocentrum cordatum TaxID=2364126 RepID=A0ABN9PZY8_9DINO|nr:unnamed protein product [Polarella glacialis]